jgi:3-isopropylmalate/(R)-2-methylmalate dehydratase small subunit
VTVDLAERTVSWTADDARDSASFDIDDYTRWRLMEGLDDVGLTLRHESEITAYEGRRPSWLPTTV